MDKVSAILGGDVGGTKVRLRLSKFDGDKLTVVAQREYSARAAPTLADIVNGFLGEYSAYATIAACLGVPGPVIEGEAKVTNLPWQIRESELVRDLNIPQVLLVNDLVATAAALPELKGNQKVDLSLPPHRDLNPTTYAVLAPGTGLGQAALYSDGNSNVILPSEGGHSDFAPQTEEELKLLQFLIREFGHVSYERILSGPGLVNLFRFFVTHGVKSSRDIADRIATPDAPRLISEKALAGGDEACIKAMSMFCDILGAQAGNLALHYLSTGGVYLGGGIPPKVLSFLSRSRIVDCFNSKGRLSHLVERTPLVVIIDDNAAVIGATRLAAQGIVGSQNKMH